MKTVNPADQSLAFQHLCQILRTPHLQLALFVKVFSLRTIQQLQQEPTAPFLHQTMRYLHRKQASSIKVFSLRDIQQIFLVLRCLFQSLASPIKIPSPQRHLLEQFSLMNLLLRDNKQRRHVICRRHTKQQFTVSIISDRKQKNQKESTLYINFTKKALKCVRQSFNVVQINKIVRL